MMCCVIAAFLFAQAMAILRRWGIYWGVVKPELNETDLPTFGKSLRAVLARPAVRTAIIAIALLEVSSVSLWLYRDHRDHIAEIGSAALAQNVTWQLRDVKICSAPDENRAITLASLPETIAP